MCYATKLDLMVLLHRKGMYRKDRLQFISHSGMMGDYLLLEWPSGLSCELICLFGNGYMLFVVYRACLCYV